MGTRLEVRNFASKKLRLTPVGRDEHGQDWIGLDQNWSQFWPDQDWIGLHFFENWRIRTGSDWENFCCFDV